MGEDRPTTDVEQRIDDLERRLARAEGRGVGERSGIEAAFWAMMHRVFPDEARRHLRNATREQLLAARVYLDHWISRMDDEQADTTARRRETIEVE